MDAYEKDYKIFFSLTFSDRKAHEVKLIINYTADNKTAVQEVKELTESNFIQTAICTQVFWGAQMTYSHESDLQDIETSKITDITISFVDETGKKDSLTANVFRSE